MQLITKLFNPFDSESHMAWYRNADDQVYEVNYEKTLKYTENEKNYALLIFSNFPSVREDTFQFREEYHAAVGCISIAKFVQEENLWNFVEFKRECDCGYGDYGQPVIPEIMRIGQLFFVSSTTQYLHQGYAQTVHTICNTTDFSKSIEYREESNSGALLEDDLSSLIDFRCSLHIEQKSKETSLTLIYEGVDQSEQGQKIDVSRKETYVYNTSTRTFELARLN